MPFHEIVGHRTVLSRISQAVGRDSLPPSLLLTGPGGVGKRLLAGAIAQALNCGAPRRDASGFAFDACGSCSACRRIAGGIYPDVVVVAPGDGGSITVDQVRVAIEQVGYRPFEGRRRVIVVDDADLLLPAAQNALLKTLEEPPPSSQLVLVTARPDMLLDTVRSRCPRLRLGHLGSDEVVGILLRRPGIDERAARSAAAAAGGSAGRALQLASSGREGIREAAIGLLRSVSAARDARARLAGARDFAAGGGSKRAPAADRQELRERLRMLASLLRDVAAVAAGAAVPLANADLDAALRDLAGVWGGARGPRAFAAVDEALDAVERNVSPKVVADWIACRL
ncbi:MAG: AAA family ATPase [Acidobacteria bacterium]|nr:AAA family ATPase [Acidobacteriota bacterium]